MAETHLLHHIGIIFMRRSVCKTTNLSYLEDMETVKGNLDTALRNVIKEINVRMASIETDIKRIRNAREGEKEQRRRVRREVVTYYEGYSEKVKL